MQPKGAGASPTQTLFVVIYTQHTHRPIFRGLACNPQARSFSKGFPCNPHRGPFSEGLAQNALEVVHSFHTSPFSKGLHATLLGSCTTHMQAPFQGATYKTQRHTHFQSFVCNPLGVGKQPSYVILFRGICTQL